MAWVISSPRPRRMGATIRRSRSAGCVACSVRHRQQSVEDITELVQGKREMTFLGKQMLLRPGDMGRKPRAVLDGDHPVLAALPDGDRRPDRSDVESPRVHERDVVIAPSGGADGERTVEAGGHV